MPWPQDEAAPTVDPPSTHRNLIKPAVGRRCHQRKRRRRAQHIVIDCNGLFKPAAGGVCLTGPCQYNRQYQGFEKGTAQINAIGFGIDLTLAKPHQISAFVPAWEMKGLSTPRLQCDFFQRSHPLRVKDKRGIILQFLCRR